MPKRLLKIYMPKLKLLKVRKLHIASTRHLRSKAYFKLYMTPLRLEEKSFSVFSLFRYTFSPHDPALTPNIPMITPFFLSQLTFLLSSGFTTIKTMYVIIAVNANIVANFPVDNSIMLPIKIIVPNQTIKKIIIAPPIVLL